MDFSTGQYVQLVVAFSLVIVAFLVAYMGPEKAIVKLLILIIPFQLVASRYGTLNVGITLLVFVAFMLNRRITMAPMLPWFGLVIFAYVISLSTAPPSTYMDHLLYILAVVANISLFYIVYNFVYRAGDARPFFQILLWLNVIFDIYCYAQLALGFESEALFGVSDLALQQNRADARLAGPFAAVGMTAEYLVVQVFILLYMLFNEDKQAKKIFLVAVMAANFAFLVASGNRGGVLVLIFSSILFFWMFHKEFGGARIFRRGVVGAALFGVMAFIVVSFTQFNVLFDRLSETEMKEGLPDTRAIIWPLAWARIQEKPWLGHGPRIRLINEDERHIPGHKFMPYPHSSVLFILYTIGVLGLVAYSTFFAVLFGKFRSAINGKNPDIYLKGAPKLAILLLLIILIDQLKVSMFRFNLTDYQQYVFALLGGLLAVADLAKRTGHATESVQRQDEVKEKDSVLARKSIGGSCD